MTTHPAVRRQILACITTASVLAVAACSAGGPAPEGPNGTTGAAADGPDRAGGGSGASPTTTGASPATGPAHRTLRVVDAVTVPGAGRIRGLEAADDGSLVANLAADLTRPQSTSQLVRVSVGGGAPTVTPLTDPNPVGADTVLEQARATVRMAVVRGYNWLPTEQALREDLADLGWGVTQTLGAPAGDGGAPRTAALVSTQAGYWRGQALPGAKTQQISSSPSGEEARVGVCAVPGDPGRSDVTASGKDVTPKEILGTGSVAMSSPRDSTIRFARPGLDEDVSMDELGSVAVTVPVDGRSVTVADDITPAVEKDLPVQDELYKDDRGVLRPDYREILARARSASVAGLTELDCLNDRQRQAWEQAGAYPEPVVVNERMHPGVDSLGRPQPDTRWNTATCDGGSDRAIVRFDDTSHDDTSGGRSADPYRLGTGTWGAATGNCLKSTSPTGGDGENEILPTDAVPVVAVVNRQLAREDMDASIAHGKAGQQLFAEFDGDRVDAVVTDTVRGIVRTTLGLDGPGITPETQVSAIAVDPRDPKTVWVTVEGSDTVYRTELQG
ncbi:hypothetical protein QP948_08045 [Corynebacterium bovis]|uniref:hypothetical protein n=1 Tax=Corynebacterium bovis TaxID=36808 RepID=UPI00254E22F5|nr:hypothetical protein [Corynebacterium bovis]MDK8511342.1 hypothetical protein [Corynebacterium bovis]